MHHSSRFLDREQDRMDRRGQHTATIRHRNLTIDLKTGQRVHGKEEQAMISHARAPKM